METADSNAEILAIISVLQDEIESTHASIDDLLSAVNLQQSNMERIVKSVVELKAHIEALEKRTLPMQTFSVLK